MHTASSIATESRFDAAATDFRRALKRCGEVQRSLAIGDAQVQVRFAGQALADALLPALAHLPTCDDEETAERRLTIDVWENAHSPIRLSHDQWLVASSQIQAFGRPQFIFIQPDTGLLTFGRGNHILACFRDVAAIPTWERTMPLRVALNAWLQQRGGQIVHAAAVASQHDAVLLVGRGGSGKSSTALSCLAAPSLSWLGDDLCLVQNDLQPTVCSLYNSLKIWEENLARFPDITLPTNAHSRQLAEKPTFFLYPHYDQKIARRRRLKGVLLPRITGGATSRLRSATAAEAWRAIVPSTSAVVFGDQLATSRNVVELLHRVPAYWLELGTDRSGIVAVIESYLHRHALPQAA